MARFEEDWLDRSSFSWRAGYVLASFSQLSYGNERAVRRAIDGIWGDDTFVFSEGRTQGLVAVGDRVVAVAFRGTQGLGDWLDNSRFSVIESDILGGRGHRGFLLAYAIVREVLADALERADPSGTKRLWFTGHSLGGALATIAAMDQSRSRPVSGTVTFGQPRGLARDAAASVAARLGAHYRRIVNQHDVVPRVPPTLTHAGRLHVLRDGELGTEALAATLPGADDFGMEGADAPVEDHGPSPLPEAEYRALMAEMEAAEAIEQTTPDWDDADGAMGPGYGAEGFIPGIRPHRVALYVDRMRQAAGVTETMLAGLPDAAVETRVEARGIEWLRAPDASVAFDRRAARRSGAGDPFDGAEGLDGSDDPFGTESFDLDSLDADFPGFPRGADPFDDLDAIESIGRIETTGAPLDRPIVQRIGARQPVVILTRTTSWRPPDGLQTSTSTGDIVTALATPAEIQALERDRDVISIEISREVEAHELQASVEFANARTLQRPPVAERGANAVIGIIDTGVDVLHEAFLDANGQTRILAIWDQYDHGTATPRRRDGGFEPDYGRLWLRDEIQRFVDGGAQPPSRLRDPHAHGTHVAGIAAGRAVGGLADGMAPDASLVVVIPRLQTEPGQPRSLGYSKTHVDAAYFLRRVARGGTAVLDDERPMAVNVSLGMMAGPHDGRTPLERAFEKVLDDGYETGFAVVKSAGNNAEGAVHARGLLSRGWQDLTWTRADDPMRERDYFEAWHDHLDTVAFRLVDPEGNASDTCSVDAPSVRATLGGNLVRLDLVEAHPHNGDRQLVIAIDAGSRAIQPGRWRLRFAASEVRSREATLDLWTEARRGRPVRFDAPRVEGTLSVPGTVEAVVAVGACGSGPELTLAPFSSRGPTRTNHPKPDLCAPGVGVLSARSGTRDGAIGMDGTSMAAPHVTGAVALAMSRLHALGEPQPNAQVILSALRRSTRSVGAYHPGFGSGPLDTGAFLEALGAG